MMMVMTGGCSNTRSRDIPEVYNWKWFAIWLAAAALFFCGAYGLYVSERAPRWLGKVIGGVGLIPLFFLVLPLWHVRARFARAVRKLWAYHLWLLVFSVPFVALAVFAAREGDHKASLIYGTLGALFLLPTVLAMLGWFWRLALEARPPDYRVPFGLGGVVFVAAYAVFVTLKMEPHNVDFLTLRWGVSATAVVIALLSIITWEWFWATVKLARDRLLWKLLEFDLDAPLFAILVLCVLGAFFLGVAEVSRFRGMPEKIVDTSLFRPGLWFLGAGLLGLVVYFLHKRVFSRIEWRPKKPRKSTIVLTVSFAVIGICVVGFIIGVVKDSMPVQIFTGCCVFVYLVGLLIWSIPKENGKPRKRR